MFAIGFAVPASVIIALCLLVYLSRSQDQEQISALMGRVNTVNARLDKIEDSGGRYVDVVVDMVKAKIGTDVIAEVAVHLLNSVRKKDGSEQDAAPSGD